MRNHYYKYLLCILLLIACVLLVILAVLSNNNPGNEKDGTASTHAPDSTSVKLALNSRRAQCFQIHEALGPTVL